MRILVVSDSHASRSFMCRCAELLQPDMMIHLGDYYEDGEVLHELYPRPKFLQVPGNCDSGRLPEPVYQVLQPVLEGVRIFLTHGHLHHVKSGIGALLADARRSGAKLVLFGHTHRPCCEQTEDGIWVLNPGTCGFGGGTVGLVELDSGAVQSCRILSEKELYEAERARSSIV